MNAADHIRLTPVLAVACAVLALLLVALWAGVGRGVRWSAPTPPPSLAGAGQAAAAAPRLGPVGQYAAIWQHPLFSENRQPEPQAAGGGAAGPAIGQLVLTGVMLTPQLHAALLRDAASNKSYVVREGSALPDGSWTLHALQPRGATFVNARGERTELELKVATVSPQRGAPPRQPASGPGTGPEAAPKPEPMGEGGVQVQQVEPASSGSMPEAPAPIPLQPQAGSPASAPADAATEARVQALKQRIEERRRRMEQRPQPPHAEGGTP
ncbi:MAG TPA: hypothetical protein VF216_01830 [Mizugakiibacter sp.]